MPNATDPFFQNQKELLDDLMRNIEYPPYDEEICPECGENLVDYGDALVCIGCGLTIA